MYHVSCIMYHVSCIIFFFFWHPFKFIAKNRLSPDVELSGECRTHNMHFMVFPSAVHYIRVFICGFLLIVSSCFFLGDHVAFDQLPVPLGGRGILRHLRGLRPLQVKTISWGRIHNIYSSSGEVKNGIYGWPVISQTRSCVGGSPCSRGGEPGSFWCGKPPRE